MKPYRIIVLSVIAASVLFSGCIDNQYKKNRIQPLEANKKYWQYKGEPVFLLGANKEDNTFQMDHLKAYLEKLKVAGGNYFRNVMSDRDEGNLKAFKLLENGKYDLNEWNGKYWQKFRNMLEWTSQRDIIVHITLWDRFDHYDRSGDEPESRLWLDSPWNPVNNINYTHSETGLDSTYTGHPASGKNPFFKTPPTMEDNSKVLNFQKKFITRIMDISLKYGNVLYNMGNEHQISLKDWDHYWCKFIQNYASTKGKKIETTAMFDKQNFHPVTKRNNLYSFVEGSKIGSQWTDPGEVQYSDAINLINSVAETEVRPVNAVKVRTQNIVYNAQERLWRPLMAGFAALSHHRHTSGYTSGSGRGHAFESSPSNNPGWPVGGLGDTQLAMTNIKAIRMFTDKIIPWETEPRQELLLDREEDEAYLIAKPGFMYGIYFPKGFGSVKLNLKDFQKSLKMQWIDIGKGEVVENSEIEGGAKIPIEPPYEVKYGWACSLTAL